MTVEPGEGEERLREAVVNGEKKANQELREVQICVRMKGIISAHFGDRRPFAFKKRKLDRRGEEGELRDKKAAASRFKLFFSLARQGMDTALEDGSMASGGWLLRITLRPAGPGDCKQTWSDGLCLAGLQQGKGWLEMSCKCLLKFCGGSLDRVTSDSHRITRGQTGKWIPESESE